MCTCMYIHYYLYFHRYMRCSANDRYLISMPYSVKIAFYSRSIQSEHSPLQWTLCTLRVSPSAWRWKMARKKTTKKCTFFFIFYRQILRRVYISVLSYCYSSTKYITNWKILHCIFWAENERSSFPHRLKLN